VHVCASSITKEKGDAMSEPIVATTAGDVRGRDVDGIRVFKGVPYGATTAGGSRFRAPVPAQPWAGVRDAIEYGPSSPQSRAGRESLVSETGQIFGLGVDDDQNEDCLVLNVWTPALDDGGKRPVLFRIHGGGYAIGSGSWAWHDGTNLARRGDVVVVTVNHRLAPVGYLYLDEIGGEEYLGSGNAGMLDLVLALEWTRDNIANFGGDPGRVMIFGESGGGLKVSTLLAMPSAKGLFGRAIVQSGPGLRAQTPEGATELAERYLAELGIDQKNLPQLDRIPVERLVEASGAIASRQGPVGLIGFSPVVDGRTLPAQPGAALAAGASADVPLVIGSTRHEAAMFMALEPGGFPQLDEAGMRARLQTLVGDRLDAAIETFSKSNPGASSTDLCVLIQSAVMMRTGSVRMAETKLAGGSAPVYMYMLTMGSPVMNGRLGAAHGMCVPLTMDNCHSAGWSDHPAGRELAARMSQAWINFATDGDPNHAELPKWPRYSLDERATMLFDNPCAAANDPYPDERHVLEGLPGPLG
jgi:para-nitrobenzyl esterase